MTRLVAQHIITPTSGIVQRTEVHGQPLTEPTMLSLLDLEQYAIAGYTPFEYMCIRAIEGAMEDSKEGLKGSEGLRGSNGLESERCVFIVSSTKGDIWTPMAVSARYIAEYFGNRVAPIVVSNACTSGVCAQLTAFRLLETERFDTAVVVGCDILSDFVISGFRSFQSLCPERCRPFDDSLQGLNLGEAAASMILSRKGGEGWMLLGGAIHNDANHISGPSRTAEGSYRCLQDALKLVRREALAAVSVHGTGTLYNDSMERLALERAGLTDVPMYHFKGTYGHTLGAAGLMETLLSMAQIREEHADFIKLLSGFGGVNAAVAWRR